MVPRKARPLLGIFHQPLNMRAYGSCAAVMLASSQLNPVVPRDPAVLGILLGVCAARKLHLTPVLYLQLSLSCLLFKIGMLTCYLFYKQNSIKLNNTGFYNDTT